MYLRFKTLFIFIAFVALMAGVNGLASPLNDLLKTSDVQTQLDTISSLPETMNKVTLLHLGVNSLVVRKKLIADSKSFIFIDVPFWVHDNNGTELLQELLRKAKENRDYEFDVIQDWASPYISNGGKQIRYELGNHVMMWNSPAWDRRFSLSLMHNHLHDKFFIVDGQHMIVGGMNMADEYLEGGKTARGWHDTDILLEGPAVQQGTATFLKLWQLGHYLENADNPFPPWEKQLYAALNSFFYNGVEDHDYADTDPQTGNKVTERVHIALKNLLTDPHYFPEQPAVTNGVPVRLIYDNPLFEHSELNSQHQSKFRQTLHFMFEHAQKTAWFYMPYLTPDKDFFDELVQAAKRLDVRIITNSYSSWDMTKRGYLDQLSHYPDLLNAGIKIYEWQGHEKLKKLQLHGLRVRTWPGDTMHSKIALFDDSVAFIGSNNMNHQSLNNNSEVMAMVNDENFAQQVRAVFFHDINGIVDVFDVVADPTNLSFKVPTLPLVEPIDLDRATQLMKIHKASDTPIWTYPIGN